MKQARCTKYRMFFMGHAFAITTSPVLLEPSWNVRFLLFRGSKEAVRAHGRSQYGGGNVASRRWRGFSSYYICHSDTTSLDIILTNKIFAFHHMNSNGKGEIQA